jgi:hypothetical protein
MGLVIFAPAKACPSFGLAEDKGPTYAKASVDRAR